MSETIAVKVDGALFNGEILWSQLKEDKGGRGTKVYIGEALLEDGRQIPVFKSGANGTWTRDRSRQG